MAWNGIERRSDRAISEFSRVLEAALGSFGILIAGIWTIPLIGKISGVEISAIASVKMSILFAIGRFIYLYALRLFFSRFFK